MTDAEYEAIQDRLRRVTDKWAEDLVPSNVDCKRYFYRTSEEYKQWAPGERSSEEDACCQTKWEYLRVGVYFNCESLVTPERDDEYIEGVVLHELCHSLVEELSPTNGPTIAWRQHNERVTSALAHAFLAVRRRAEAYEPVTGEY